MDYPPQPLIFITATDGTIPQGRNVRAQARAREVALRAPPQHHNNPGCFIQFALEGSSASAVASSPRRVPRQKANSSSSSSRSQMLSRGRPRLRTTPSPLAPSPCGVDPAAILALARFHIARTGMRLVQVQPDRLADALRWRHWGAWFTAGMFGVENIADVVATHASIAPITIGERTACVDSALTCLSTKLDDLLRFQTNDTASPRVLAAYDRALIDLRRALAGFAVVRREDLLVTSQILAVFEMLHNPNSDSWVSHAIGAVSLMMSSKSKHRIAPTAGWPVLTGALLDSGKGPYANAPRQALSKLVLANAKNTSNKLIPIIQQTAVLVDQRWRTPPSPSPPNSNSINKAQTLRLLASAHSLRSELISIATTMSRTTNAFRRPPGDDFDYLGFGLVCLLALDRVIIALRPAGRRPLVDIDDKTHALCTQILWAELWDAERDLVGS